ncbi:hypothetical protein R3P38DRAFT_3371067 [Favolaschia claudopus]|uniref:Uncharacterized protein n=1 Tax=Favolaschia claudopus TaxID=2862362 RepID=A0AAV9ZZR8_9AGAR
MHEQYSGSPYTPFVARQPKRIAPTGSVANNQPHANDKPTYISHPLRPPDVSSQCEMIRDTSERPPPVMLTHHLPSEGVRKNGELICIHANRPPPAIVAHSHQAKQRHNDSRRSRAVCPGRHSGVSAGRKVTGAWASRESRLFGEGTATAAKKAEDGVDGIENESAVLHARAKARRGRSCPTSQSNPHRGFTSIAEFDRPSAILVRTTKNGAPPTATVDTFGGGHRWEGLGGTRNFSMSLVRDGGSGVDAVKESRGRGRREHLQRMSAVRVGSERSRGVEDQ